LRDKLCRHTPFRSYTKRILCAQLLLKAGCAEVSVMGEREATVPSAGELIRKLQHSFEGRLRRDSD
jgi:hypothetical protein